MNNTVGEMSTSRRYGKARDYEFGTITLMLRERAHLTQKELAKRIGVSTRAIQKWEGGSNYPTGEYLKKLIETYVIQQVFSAGKEAEEAEELWDKVRQKAPRLKVPFDQTWFAEMVQEKLPPSSVHSHRIEQVNVHDISVHSTSNHISHRVDRKSQIPFPGHLDSHQEDWGEAIDVSMFYGRDVELDMLEHWIMDDRCRLVVLLGMGGIGKTALSVKLAHRIAEYFEFVIWRSLRNAPPIEEIVTQCISFLSEQALTNPPAHTDGKISLLIELLQERRCLLILDNIETILQEGNREGRYREGYEAYGQLLQRLGGVEHHSCLILTSREKPKEVGPLEGTNTPVRSLKLTGLGREECQSLLQGKELFGAEICWEELITRYSGNPLALQIVAETIREVFGGDIAAFLHEGAVLFDGVQQLLKAQFERLSEEEQAVMYWLCIERELVALEAIAEELFPSLPRRQVLEVVEALRRRSLIERGSQGATFTLQPMVLEYVSDHLIEQVSEEIEQGKLSLLVSHALLKTQSKEYVRYSQIVLLLKPVLDKLSFFRGEQGTEQHLLHLLTSLRERISMEQGYAGGNIVNLLAQLKGNLKGYDFSGLNLWEAYLSGVELQDVSFARSNLARSVFADTFDAILSVTFSPDGGYLAAGSANGEIRLWRSGEWRPYVTLHGHRDWVWSVIFSPDGRLLASSSEDKTVKIWDVVSGQCITTLQGHTGKTWSVAFSPDGRILALGGMDRTIKLLHIASGQYTSILQGHNGWIMSVAFSSDGRFLASSAADQTVKLWNAKTGECLKTLSGHSNIVWSVTFNPDGTILASGSADQTVRLWEVSNGKCLQILEGHTDWVQSVAFSPNGSILASCSEDHTVKLWAMSNGNCLKTLSGHTSIVWSIAFSPDGNTLVTGSRDRSIKIWEVNSGQCLETLQGYASAVWSATFSPKGSTFISGGDDQLVRIWDVRSGQCLRTLQGHKGLVYSTAYSPDGDTLASGGADQTVRLWSASKGQSLRVLHGHTRWVCSVAFDSTGKTLASGGADQKVRLWNAASGVCLNVLHGHTNWVWSVAFSPDNHVLASGGADQTIRLWSMASGECLNVLHGHTNWVWSVAFSPDNHVLASGSADQTIKLWERVNGECLMTLSEHTGVVSSVAFNTTGSLLVSGGEDQTIKLWEVTSGKCLKTLQGHESRIRSVAFGPDGNILISASDDETMKLWNVQTGMCLKTVRSDRPYERMNISEVTGLTKAQKAVLRALGAVES